MSHDRKVCTHVSNRSSIVQREKSRKDDLMHNFHLFQSEMSELILQKTYKIEFEKIDNICTKGAATSFRQVENCKKKTLDRTSLLHRTHDFELLYVTGKNKYPF